jgi:hypothetical protein
VNLAQWLRLVPKLEHEYHADDPDPDTLAERILKTRYRADLVPELPSSAPAGYLMVKAGDPFLYVGAGMANPLRRIPTQALPS